MIGFATGEAAKVRKNAPCGRGFTVQDTAVEHTVNLKKFKDWPSEKSRGATGHHRPSEGYWRLHNPALVLAFIGCQNKTMPFPVEIVVATPLSGVSQPYSFSNNPSIRSLAPIDWDRAIVKGYLSDHDKDDLRETKFWLCASSQTDNPYGDHNELTEMAHRAMYATQIICPIGGKNIFLTFQKTSAGYDNIGTVHAGQLNTTLLTRVIRLEDQNLSAEFDPVFAGVQRAFDEKVVRLQNPVLLIEHGLVLSNVPLSTLFFVMALDMLFMAPGEKLFCSRINGFLGADTLVFPPEGYLYRQAVLKVSNVLTDLYRFRNIIAHGNEIPKTPYRESCGLLDTSGGNILTGVVSQTYLEILHQAALFILCRSLRKMFADNLLDTVKEKNSWRKLLDTTTATPL